MGPSGNDGKSPASLHPFALCFSPFFFLTIVTVLAFTGDLQRFTIIVPGDTYFATGTRSLVDGGLTRIGVAGVGPVGSAIDQNDDRWIYSQVLPSSLSGYVITGSGSFTSFFSASTNPTWIPRKYALPHVLLVFFVRVSCSLISDHWFLDSMLTFLFLLSSWASENQLLRYGSVRVGWTGIDTKSKYIFKKRCHPTIRHFV
jgi:hypothetical protein